MSEVSDNTKLNKNITSAVLPYVGVNSSGNMDLIEAQCYLLDSAKSQLGLIQSLATGVPTNEEIQITAGSLSGSCENLINQLGIVEAITGGLHDQLQQLSEELETLKKSIKNTGGGL